MKRMMKEIKSEELGSDKFGGKETSAERILKEWSAVVQLYIHHDNLKQTRINHFLSIQAALLAFVGVSTKFAFEGATTSLVNVTFLSFSTCISMVGAFLAKTWRTMDTRARKFTIFHRKRIRELECEWRALYPGDKRGLMTFTSLAIVLESPPGEEDFLFVSPEERTRVEKNFTRDYPILKNKGKTASGREYTALTLIFAFWILSIAAHIGLILIPLFRG
jgi:hypothetical protein